MIPVYTLMQVGAHYDAIGFSCLYMPLLPGGAPERKTMIYLRDGQGHIVGGILSDAKKLAEVMS
jgi:hypothetical protein